MMLLDKPLNGITTLFCAQQIILVPYVLCALIRVAALLDRWRDQLLCKRHIIVWTPGLSNGEFFLQKKLTWEFIR